MEQSFTADAAAMERLSHDIRTPLNIIIGFTELLLDNTPGRLNGEQRQCLSEIRQAADRILAVLDTALEGKDRGPA